MLQIQDNVLKMPAPELPPAPAADPLAPTIFHEPWWLDIATNGKHGVTEVTDDDGKVVGRLPYLLQSSFGIRRGVMPALAHFLGPAVIDGEGGADTRFLKRLEITRELIRKLPSASSYSFKCHGGMPDSIAFQREHFLTTVQFTHVIAPRASADLWKAMQHKRRSVITRAQKVLTPLEVKDPQVLVGFMQRNIDAYGIDCYYSMDACSALIKTSIEKERGRIMVARDPNGEFAAATFCVWDATSYYLFITARKPSTYRGSLTLLVWEAMKDAAARNLVFDMDGISSDESVAFFSGFGATVVPRYIVTRENKLMRVVRAIKHTYRKLNYYC